MGRIHQVAGDLGLTVNDDSLAGQVCNVDTDQSFTIGQVETHFDQPFGFEARVQPQPLHQADSDLFEHASANAGEDMFAGLAFDHEAINTLGPQQVTKQQACRASTDNGNLRFHNHTSRAVSVGSIALSVKVAGTQAGLESLVVDELPGGFLAPIVGEKVGGFLRADEVVHRIVEGHLAQTADRPFGAAQGLRVFSLPDGTASLTRPHSAALSGKPANRQTGSRPASHFGALGNGSPSHPVTS